MPAVLFLCTGNLCRSPSAAALLRRRVVVSGPDGIVVHSAGTVQTFGPPPAPLVDEAHRFGVDLADHEPRQMEVDELAASDLIIGMTREHVRDAVLLDRAIFLRTFTLREFVRRGNDAGARSAGRELADWVSALHTGRRHVDLIGESPSDDIDDPMGGPPEAYREMLSEVAPLVDALHALVWGAAGTT